jgi:hypothetical protein
MDMPGWLFGNSSNSEDEYGNGYHAAHEFADIVDCDMTDEQITAHWNAVESGHSEQYVEGYEQGVYEEATRPWWKVW